MKYTPIIILILIMHIVACKQGKENTSSTHATTNEHMVTLSNAQYRHAQIQTSTLSSKRIASTIKVHGRIDVPPQNIVMVSTPLGGYIKSISLLPGMHVNKGQIIAMIEDPQYIQLQQDYLLAKTKLQLATLEYDRQHELNEHQASSNKITEQALAELNTQKITVNALAEKLRMINKDPASISPETISRAVPIYSVISGFVSKVNVNIGKYVSPADVIVELIDPSDIHLTLNAFEKDLTMLAIGQGLTCYNNIKPDKKYRAEIIAISKDINPSGTSEVHCHFDQYHKELLPGMYMNADINTVASTTNTLPEESIVSFGGKDFVFVQRTERQYEMVEVEIENKEKGIVSIQHSDHLNGQKIVSKNAYTLLMALKNKEED